MEDLKAMIYDDEVKAVWAASGGYAVTEVMPVFNRETIEYLKSHPKWFVGYSDVCLILNVMTSLGMVSVMGPNIWGLDEWDKSGLEMLRKVLFGPPSREASEGYGGIGTSANWKSGLAGVAEGRVVASNLELLILSFGTNLPEIFITVKNRNTEHNHIAFGNVVGSAVVNVLILGIVSLISPIIIPDLRVLLTSIVFLLIITVCFNIFLRTKNTLSRGEGVTLIVIYILFIITQGMNR